MSLFGSIQLGANTLRAMQIGLQVTGNNIANANTPGFIHRKRSSPPPVQKIGNLVGLRRMTASSTRSIVRADRLSGAGDRGPVPKKFTARSRLAQWPSRDGFGTGFTNFINRLAICLRTYSAAAHLSYAGDCLRGR
jgi:hypothetical protein